MAGNNRSAARSLPARGRAVRMGASLLFLLVVTALVAASASGAPPPIAIATGQDAGWPDVRGWTRLGAEALQIAPWGYNPVAFSAYPTYQYGVRVAVGDVTGDRKADIVTAPGKGGWTELRVFDGTSFRQTGTVAPFRDASWWNGAFVATGDTNGDGRDEIVDGLDSGCCTTIHVLDAATGAETAGFFPFRNSYESGVRVAAADLNGDGKSEILAVPPGNGRVYAFGTSGGEPFRTYEAFAGDVSEAVTMAAGDVSGDPRPELVAATNTSAGVQVKVIDTQSGATLASFLPFTAAASATPQVAVGDVDGDGRGDLVVAAQLPDGTVVKALTGDGKQLTSFYVLEPGIVPGASLAAGDLDGDGMAEIVIGGGPTLSAPSPSLGNGPDQRVIVYRADGTLVGGFKAYPGLFQGGVRVALLDTDRNGRPDVVTAPGPDSEPEIEIFSQQWLQSRDRGTRFGHFLAYERSFRGGVSVAGAYWADAPAIVTAPGPGHAPEVRVFDGQGRLWSSFAAFESSYTGGLSVAAGDLNADGRPEIVVGTLTAPARVRAFEFDGQPAGPMIGPFPPDGRGVQVSVADVNGNGRGLVVAGETGGADPGLTLIDPATGAVVGSARPAPAAENGLRVGAGDLDQDGRDEILVATGWGGDGVVRVLGPRLGRRWSLQVYGWTGGGMNVTAAARRGLPLRANALTARLKARVRTRVVMARFHDAAGGASASSFRATIDWGDGTTWRGVVVPRGHGDLDVRSTKRYAHHGTYRVEVTLQDVSGRVAVAKSAAIVRR